MCKKRLVLCIIVIFAAGALLLYFRPLPLAVPADEKQDIMIIEIELGVRDGETYMDSKSYNSLTKTQKSEMADLFQRYKYRRTFGTIFSDGSFADLGDKLVQIFTYENDELIHTVSISSTDHISVDGRTYFLSDSVELIIDLLKVITE